MNISSFLNHWSIRENPFRAEEARHDPVFQRLGVGPTTHPDFEKIVGDLAQPSTSIVFGEKGSGKTAIRLQLAQRVAEHNLGNPDRRVMLVPYDDLNPIIDQFCLRQGVDENSDDKKIMGALQHMRLIDHMDGVLHVAVTRYVDRLLGEGEPDDLNELGDNAVRSLRKAPDSVKRDLLLLQAAYDRDADAPERTRRLRRLIRARGNRAGFLWKSLACLGWLLPAGILALWIFKADENANDDLWLLAVAIGGAIWLILLLIAFVVEPWLVRRTAKRFVRQLHSLRRTSRSLGASLAQLPSRDRAASVLWNEDIEEQRYAMFGRLRRVLQATGCRGMIVILDRMDEPTLVNGDPNRMRAVVWPLLNNKFLQQSGIGFKLLLPIELRYELFRESTAFFQEARLDKQNLIERLQWTGSMLYDLCTARLNACRENVGAGADVITLTDLFESDVTRQDIVDALDQMHQPRDAFKLLYQAMQEHCSGVTEEQAHWRIPRLILETVRKQQSDRVQAFYRGVRPA
jgi:hypothetical protein